MLKAVSQRLRKPVFQARSLLTNETALYIFKRGGQAVLTLFFASVLSFILIQCAPGDYLDTLRQNPQITQETIADLERRFGLNQPAYVQYFYWLLGIITDLDFGTSFVYFRPVSDLIIERIPATLLLTFSSILVTWSIAIPLGILGAVRQNQLLDRFLRFISYLGQGFPTLITALILLYFAQLTSPLFPVAGMTSINHSEFSLLGKILDIGWHLILPTIALSISGFARLQRLTRGQLLDVLRQDYIQMARAKGLPENRVIYVHALRNAVNPLITLLGFEFATLLSGAFSVEFFFNWPGLGRLTLRAVLAQDIYLVMASLMMSALMLIVGNLLADLALKKVDPRIQLGDSN